MMYLLLLIVFNFVADFIGLIIFVYVRFFVEVKGLYELVQTARRRGVGSVVTLRS